jgi:menaquinone-dependent protoporphyrinogen oxidase
MPGRLQHAGEPPRHLAGLAVVALEDDEDVHGLSLRWRRASRMPAQPARLALASSRPPVERFGAVVVGGSIRMGKHQKALVGFCRENRDALLGRPHAFFSVSMSARRRFGKGQDEVSKHVSRFVAATGWVPERLWSIAGALQYTKYPWHIRAMLKLIAAMTGAATDTSRDWEYTDWSAVDALGEGFAEALPWRAFRALSAGSLPWAGARHDGC